MNNQYEYDDLNLYQNQNTRKNNKNNLDNYPYLNRNNTENNDYKKNNSNKIYEKLNNEIKMLKINNTNFLKQNKKLKEKLILKEKEISNLSTLINTLNITKKEKENINKDLYIINNNNDNTNDIKKLQKLLDESNILNNKLKENIKNLNEEISSLKNNNIININKINELIKSNDEKYNKIVLLENDLIKTKKEIINKNDKINNLNDKYFELVAEINKNKKEINEQNQNRILFEKKSQNEINVLKNKIEELEFKNKRINVENKNLKEKSERQIEEIKKQETLINELNDKIKLFENNNNNINNYLNNNITNENISESKIEDKKEEEDNNHLNSLDSVKILENNINIKRPSTPSFKSIGQNDNEDNVNKEEIETNKELKKINDLLLNKIKEYESILNINEVKDIDKKNIEINDLKDGLNNNENENDINFFKNKYLNYYRLYQDYKKKLEYLQTENEALNEQLKNNNNNNNNLITTFSAIKLNYQYNPNEYFILCDKKYKELKWYLMKKQSEYSENDTYDNLIWVSALDVVDIDNFNEYSIEEESENVEMMNLIKKLEEKENIISKLSYQNEKLKKDNELYKNNNINNNSLYNNELFIESNNNSKININKKKKINKSHNKTIKYFKNAINEDNLFNDNKCVINFKKGLSYRDFEEEKKIKNRKILKTDESDTGVPLAKFNIILEKLNKTEADFAKLQKENMELRKNQRFYLSQNNNIVNIIPNNDNDKEKNDNENNCIINFSSDINKLTLMGNNFINNINDDGLGLLNNNIKSNNQNQIEDYKIKIKNLENKIKTFKDSCKNILIKLKIPKKRKRRN